MTVWNTINLGTVIMSQSSVHESQKQSSQMSQSSQKSGNQGGKGESKKFQKSNQEEKKMRTKCLD